jgi:tetratricopeptide (TPR) repeat protein
MVMISMLRVDLSLFVVFVWLSLAGPAQSVEYAVDGWKLGSTVTSSALQSYGCEPSDDFAQLTSCDRKQTRNRGYSYSAFGSVMHDENGVIVFLEVKVTPVQMTKKDIQTEIIQLSGEFGSKPQFVDWVAAGVDRPESIIVRWGQIKLEQIESDTSEEVESGQNPKIGVLVDSLGDVRRSAKLGSEIYRIAGGTGFIYTASFDKNGRGHRQYIAANGDELVIRQYEVALPALLAKDQGSSADDFQLWPQVADITRRLARDISPETANETLDEVFEKIPSKKYRSHVWALLPGGAIQHLAMHQHWDVDIYGPKTEHPEIRSSIQAFLASRPSEPFIELLYYVIGEYDRAVQVNPKSPLSDVLHYASGFRKLGPLLHDAIQIVKSLARDDTEEPDEIFRKINFLIQNQSLYGDRPLSTVVPNFAARAAAARAHFEEVLRDPKAPHADDAAFLLGWLTMHEGKPKEDALPYFSRAMTVGNGDYKDPGAMGRILRILDRLSSSEQLAIVDADSAFSRQPALAYVAARSAYRDFNYAVTIDAAARYLKGMGIQPETLPATTDPDRIDKALEGVDQARANLDTVHANSNLREIPYILQASKELWQYEKYLRGVDHQPPEIVVTRARTIIIKYSKLLDGDDNQDREQRDKKPGLPDFSHKDLRQAIHLIDITLANTRSPSYARLREWLYYRKARVAAVFAPRMMPDIFAAMSAEFPNSSLLDDVLAEQLFAQGMIDADLDAARATFKKLVSAYPNGNAIDNAYSWMAIILRCNGQLREAEKLNREIIRRFPFTRHAAYARERIADPKTCTAAAYSEED